ncbi:Rieske 2Fe-2S domain-containing protein [Sinosporangium siamense]|uniref:Rieske 2Fe-2S domain-containing protein n=1 Tax=Sinosporangium siamense TaxID=1367973 RepID=UPI00194FAD49|nr:Rieske 2Fe-2S domain-containing protein [Sinosporangium siamense]
MKEAVKPGRKTLKRIVPPDDLTDRLEHSTVFDGPIIVLAKAVRQRVRPGALRDFLHGVPTGKPLHPPFANFTLGCWMATAVLDLAHGDGRATRTLLAAGIGGALPTAAAGIVDWSSLHREQQRVGFVHALSNVTALGMYTASLLLRLAGRERAGRITGFMGLTAATVGGYLGGHMAYRQAAGANHAESVAHLVPLGWHDMGQIKNLPDGRPVTRRLGYIDLFVLRRGTQVIVLADHCSHLAGPLHQGKITMLNGEVCVTCPWHGSTFRLADGSVAHGPATAPQPTFETRVSEDGMIQVRPALP